MNTMIYKSLLTPATPADAPDADPDDEIGRLLYGPMPTYPESDPRFTDYPEDFVDLIDTAKTLRWPVEKLARRLAELHEELTAAEVESEADREYAAWKAKFAANPEWDGGDLDDSEGFDDEE